MGTAQFLFGMTVFVVAGSSSTPSRGDLRFDDYPFIFLTLMLSLQASYAAPLILLAQNRQADRDRVGLEQDRARDERNLADTEFLTREVAALRHAMRDAATRDFVRSELRSLLDELEERGLEVRRREPGDGARRRDRFFEGPAPDLAWRHAPAPAPVTEDALLQALSTVIDPEIRKPVTELGMVERVVADEAGAVAVTILLTVSGCPMKETLTRTPPPRSPRCPASRPSTSRSAS